MNMLKKMVPANIRPGAIQTPSAAQKIVQVNQNLGLNGMAAMQGGPANIFDTVLLTGSTSTRNTFTFFNATNSKSKTFTNWNQTGFNAGESLAATTLTLVILQLSAANLNLDTTSIQAVIPFGTDAADEADKTIALGTCNLKIANKDVFNNVQMIEALPYFNPANTGIWAGDGTAITPQTTVVYGVTTIQLPTIPVIVPNMTVELTLNFGTFAGAPTANRALMVSLGRQGSIFNNTTAM